MPFLCSGPVFFMDLASGTGGSSKGKGRDFFGCNDLFGGPCGELCKSVAGGVFVEGYRGRKQVSPYLVGRQYLWDKMLLCYVNQWKIMEKWGKTV